MACRSCHDDLVHCHGVLLLHLDGPPECSDDGCAGPDPVLHEFWMLCDVCQAHVADDGRLDLAG